MIVELGLVVEAMLPQFNTYDGGLAIGAQSDLYVLSVRPPHRYRHDRGPREHRTPELSPGPRGGCRR